MYVIIKPGNDIYHHGVKGQKWGVRHEKAYQKLNGKNKKRFENYHQIEEKAKQIMKYNKQQYNYQLRKGTDAFGKARRYALLSALTLPMPSVSSHLREKAKENLKEFREATDFANVLYRDYKDIKMAKKEVRKALDKIVNKALRGDMISAEDFKTKRLNAGILKSILNRTKSKNLKNEKLRKKIYSTLNTHTMDHIRNYNMEMLRNQMHLQVQSQMMHLNNLQFNSMHTMNNF